MLLQGGEGDDLEGPLVGGGQHHVGGRALLVSPQPVHRGHAPTVAGHESREVVSRHRRGEVVADASLVLEKLRRHHCADRVAAAVLGARAAAPVPVEPGDGVDTAGVKLSTQHIAIGHPTSIAERADHR